MTHHIFLSEFKASNVFECMTWRVQIQIQFSTTMASRRMLRLLDFNRMESGCSQAARTMQHEFGIYGERNQSLNLKGDFCSYEAFVFVLDVVVKVLSILVKIII